MELLISLPAIILKLRLEPFYRADTGQLVCHQLVWAYFDSLFVALHNDTMNAPQFRQLAQQFARIFEFTHSTRFSPYMHALVDHVHIFIDLYGELHSFSCQKIERYHKVSFALLLLTSDPKVVLQASYLGACRH